MAVTKKQMQNAIAGYQKQGLTGNQILVKLSNRKDAIGDSFRDDMKNGSSTEFAQVFGLKIDRSPVQVNQPKNATLWDKAASYGTSALMGLSDTGGGIIQGVAATGDFVNKKINNTFGTNLSTNASATYQKEHQRAEVVTKARRTDAGRKGGDWVRGGTEIAATLPAFMLGNPTGLGVRVAAQGAIGGAVGAAHYADDSKQRKNNIIGGVIGGAGGELAGAAVGKIATKGYNAVKGNLKPQYSEVAKLGKKHGVRTSVGDIARNPIVKKTEVASENVPVLGMAGFRQAQNTEAKTAVQGVVGKLENVLTATDYKALDKIQKAANGGDRNAQRILGIVNNAGNNPNNILQASLEVRQWREKSIASKLYDRVGDKIKALPNTKVTPTKTLDTLNGKIDELSKSFAPDESFVKDLNKIKANFDDPNKVSDFGNMRKLRSQLGDLAERYAQGSNPNRSASAFFGDLRQAVEKDITDFVASTGDNSIISSYKRADGYYKGMVTRQDRSLAKAMKTATPDEIMNTFIKVGKGDRAVNFYNALDQKGQAALRLQMANNAFDKAWNENTQVFSPAKFAQEFERMREPYGNVFKGQDKAEMDGFVKLMRHVERAGQYMENPPTGNRAVGVLMGGAAAVSPTTALQIGGATALAKTLFTTKAGKNLLLAASKLPPEAAGLGNILKLSEKLMADTGAHIGMSNGDTPTTDAPVTDPNTVADASQMPTVDAPVTDVANPMIDPQALSAPQAQPVFADTPSVDMSQPQATPTDTPNLSPMPTQIAPSDIVPSAEKNAPVSDTAQSEPQPQVTAINHVGSALQSLIAPPKDPNPQKQAVYEQISQQAVGTVLNTPQMQQITTELESPQPNDRKIQSLQKSLAQTPEWQAYLETLPKQERQQMSSANVMELITRNISRNDSPVFNPTF